MARSDDPAKQAADFLAAWQEHITKQMTDPAVIQSMLAGLSAFNPRGTHDASTRRPAPAYDADDDAIRDLARRLAAVERELMELRQSVSPKAKKPARAKHGVVAKPKRTVAKRPKPSKAKRKKR